MAYQDKHQGICTRVMRCVVLLLLFVLAARPGRAQDGPIATKNPLQVATLHWYVANQTTQFPVAGLPTGVVFDGEDLWIASAFGNAITKLRPSDGTILATYPVPGPYVLAYDGANIWATNCGGNAVTKVRPSDGTILGSFPVGSCNSALVFDGTNIWVGAHNIVKLRASDGANLGSFDIGNTDQNPSQGLAFDGTNIWAPNTGTNSAPGNTVKKLRASDGQILGTFTVGSVLRRSQYLGGEFREQHRDQAACRRRGRRSTLGNVCCGDFPRQWRGF